MSNRRKTSAKGRGSQIRPPNRFDPVRVEDDFEDLEPGDEWLAAHSSPKTQFIPDESRSVVTENDSPDVGFRYSLNPYRGCEHGCAYCYARPTHEYLGLSAGLDFETKIFVKHRAPELFREWLARDAWRPEVICFSGVTDCYQPAERRFKLTRGCLEVALKARQPVSIVTKNALVLRDLDILRQMAAFDVVAVNVSVTTLDESLARTMEPRTSPPEARLGAVQRLREAGVPANVMVAPVIPGLNDSEIPEILRRAKQAGALSAHYILLRLPLTVRPVFLDWLARSQPARSQRVEAHIRSTRDGRLNDSQFGSRMRGTGTLAEQIRQTFEVFARKHGLDGGRMELSTAHFRPPRSSSGQLRLF